LTANTIYFPTFLAMGLAQCSWSIQQQVSETHCGPFLPEVLWHEGCNTTCLGKYFESAKLKIITAIKQLESEVSKESKDCKNGVCSKRPLIKLDFGS